MTDIHERLKQARIGAGYERPTDAAKARGWRPSTYLGHENGDRIPGRDSVLRYARAFRVSADWLLTGKGDADRSPSGLIDADLELAPIVGNVQAGAWLRVEDMSDEPKGTMPIAKDSRFKHLNHYAMEVIGDSCDLLVPDGGHVVFVRWPDTGLELREGMPVIAEHTQGGGFAERTLKVVEANPTGVGLRLAPRSRNPKYKPLVFAGDGEVQVIGLAVQFISPAVW